MKTLLLIDANSIIHRSFHALPSLTSKDGKPVQAIYGLSSIFLKLFRENKPDYAAALFDRPEPTFRKEKYAEYKAQRPKAPDELVQQIIEARNFFPAFGIKAFEKPGFEADDLIATLAEKFKNEPDVQVVILTGDRDTLQLVEGEKVVVRTFKTGISDTITYDERAVIEKYSLRPNQLIDYKALVGDQSDNIKGVPGIGPKTAVAVLNRFGTLEDAYNHLSDDSKLEARLKPFRKDAFLAKELVTLERNAPIELGGIESLKLNYTENEVKKFFAEMGFEALLRRLENGILPQKAKPNTPPTLF
ncbi:MAG: 5'-3' exonuclease H3TH domain-containing protein [Patescibacteria group bacterium]